MGDGGGDWYRPTALEVAWGWVPGWVPAPAEHPRRGGDPRVALAEAVLEGLRRPPCLVAFSGGRDSSAVLAVAVDAARRHGLTPPVPYTRRFPDAPSTDESAWQELVVRHLGLTEWVRQPFHDELDVLGLHATAGLRRHGLLWPPLIHGHAPILELAAGGSVLTGEGGDEVFGPQRITPLVQAVRRVVPLNRRTLGHVALAVAPVAARRRAFHRLLSRQDDRPYLRSGTRRRYDEALAGELAGVPLRWDRAVRARSRLRALQTGLLCNLDHLARGAGVRMLHPLVDPGFLAAFAARGGAWGHVRRSDGLRIVSGDLLPEAVLTRATKAEFTAGVFREPSRAFARRWDGTGVDPGLVDPERLRAAWLEPRPDARSYLLLQQAWLATEGA